MDVLIEIAINHKGVLGARMTGGGFGGCIVALVQKDHAEDLVLALTDGYPKKFPGMHCTTHILEGASDGARTLPLYGPTE